MRYFTICLVFSTVLISCKKDNPILPDNSGFAVQISAKEDNSNESFELVFRTGHSFLIDDIKSLGDGNFVFCGSYNLSSVGYPVLASINSSGTVNWVNDLRSLAGTGLLKIAGYESGVLTILAARRYSDSMKGGVLKFDSSGTLLSEQYFPSVVGRGNYQFDIVESGGDLFISAIRNEFLDSRESIYNVLDVNSGSIILNGTFNNFQSTSMSISSSGIVVITGDSVTDSSTIDNRNYLHVLNFNGAHLFSKQSSELGGRFIISASPLYDNSILAALISNDGSGTNKFVKIDNQGNVVFSVQNSNARFCIDADNDRFFVFASPYEEIDAERIFAYSLSTGELIWSKILDNNRMIQTLKLSPSSDGGVFVSQVLNKVGMNTFSIKKLDSNGN
ncbi:MAG: hypothetical protein R2850_13465 [Bacteroidia bacterium]